MDIASIAVAAALGNGPYGTSLPNHPEFAASPHSVGPVGEVTTSGFVGGYGEPLYPYEAQQPWQHGYFQEIPAYGGYHSFRPHNYKHVLSQSQTAAGFGMSPVMPYSQQFWHRYENRANLSPYAGEPIEVPQLPADPPPRSHALPPGFGKTLPKPSAVPMEGHLGPMIVPAAAEDRVGEETLERPGRWAGWKPRIR